MDFLKLQVNRDAYKKERYKDMSKSQEDAYNDFLSQIVSRKIDPRYNDYGHQYLQDINGNTYYFDSFKYIYPAPMQEDTKDLQALNSNVFGDQVNIVKYNGTHVLLSKYGRGSVESTIYSVTDETNEYINTAYGNPIDIGYFLLQVSGENVKTIDSMQKGQTIRCTLDYDELIIRDSEYNVIERKEINVKDYSSFYEIVKDRGNIESLLNYEQQGISR